MEINEVQRQKDLKMLKNSYLMYENTKRDTEKKMKNAYDSEGNKMYTEEKIKEELDLITEAQSDVVQKFANLGGDVEELKTLKRTPRKNNTKQINTLFDKYDVEDNAKKEYESQLQTRNVEVMREQQSPTETIIENKLTLKLIFNHSN